MQSHHNLAWLLAFFSFVFLAACSGDSPGDAFTGDGGSMGTGGLTGGGGMAGSVGVGGMVGTGGIGAGGSSGACFPALCPDGNSYGCGDCMDNDDDGLVDDKDPECLGPCDGTEGPVLLTGTPGETGNQCKADRNHQMICLE